MNYHDIEKMSREVREEIALMREEQKEYTATIVSVILANSGLWKAESAADTADAMIEAAQRRAQLRVQRRHY